MKNEHISFQVKANGEIRRFRRHSTKYDCACCYLRDRKIPNFIQFFDNDMVGISGRETSLLFTNKQAETIAKKILEEIKKEQKGVEK
jgi:hypothetical protein